MLHRGPWPLHNRLDDLVQRGLHHQIERDRHTDAHMVAHGKHNEQHHGDHDEPHRARKLRERTDHRRESRVDHVRVDPVVDGGVHGQDVVRVHGHAERDGAGEAQHTEDLPAES